MQLILDHITMGLIASLTAGAATGLGAIPVLLGGQFSRRTLDLMMGLAAGVMLSASAFSLLVPALDTVTDWSGVITVVAFGLALGALFVHLADKYIPHEHFERGHEGRSSTMSKVWLLVLAITIHNFPEGLAVGVSFGTADSLTGISVAFAIGLQNVPEGLAVAAPMVGAGYSKRYSAALALLTGLVEPVGGALGVTVVTVAAFLLPYGLAFAAGAMIFVVSDEIIPESHAGGNERIATWGIISGFIVMMVLDNVFNFLFGPG